MLGGVTIPGFFWNRNIRFWNRLQYQELIPVQYKNQFLLVLNHQILKNAQNPIPESIPVSLVMLTINSKSRFRLLSVNRKQWLDILQLKLWQEIKINDPIVSNP